MDLRQFVLDVPDFPSPGILFRDITPLLASPEAFSHAIVAMADPFRRERPEKVLGIEARGFMFGAALARELGIGFVPARKAGKLPRATLGIGYGLEYGKDRLEVHADAFGSRERVLVADDVLATGGTAAAAAELAERLGAEVLGATFLVELTALSGRSRLPGRRVHSVLVL
jgi:adenine phosphoribosyltransferase